MNGNSRGTIPNLAELQSYAVNRKGQYEGIRQTLYDFQTYAAAGQTSLSFFQVPLGQAGKTVADTNIEVAGSLPQPKHFLVESIEVRFWPGVLPVVSQTGVLGTQAASNYTNDVETVSQSGSLNFFIGSKTYLEEAPIGRFPPKTKVEAYFAVSQTVNQAAPADQENQITMDLAYFCGRPYFINPATLLIPTQNFKVTLAWPAAVALPSLQDARIGVVLDGILYRQSQ
jgi:hypothetical protein